MSDERASTELSGTERSTSPELESIVSGFRLRVCEVIWLNKGDRQFRLDFVAESDAGTPLVCGASTVVFREDDSPREFAKSLRCMADNLDAYWARAFPSAVSCGSCKLNAEKEKSSC